MTSSRTIVAAAVLALVLAPVGARAQSMPMPTASAPAPSAPSAPTAPPVVNVPVVPNPPRPGWQRPVDDDPHFSYLLFDQLEYRTTSAGSTGTRFDAIGWTGGDVTRLWFKSEGFVPSGSARDRDAEVSVLYGKLVRPFYDVQAGVRFVAGLGMKPSRTYAVVGYQGLAPYNFDVEPSLFISQSGKISGRFTGTYDIPFSQRLFLQPRLETNLGLQSDRAIGVGSGVDDIDLGLRLRYELRREFAPYVGVTWLQRFGQTHAFAARDGADGARFPIVAGLRVWF